MITRKFQNLELGLLGFGTMRLPLNKDGSIDEPQVYEMTKYALEHGINYFDTAAPYHQGMSEIVIGKTLKNFPRDSYYLASKYPGHQHVVEYKPQETFENQLKKCQVDYFDFYLLHNVCENSYGVYTDEKWGIVDYFIQQKKQGRIKHLGFSSHARPETLEKFLAIYGKDLEFCQIQFNYLDYSLQDAKTKLEILARYNIPVWVMEPLRGGKLVNLNEEQTDKLKVLRPDARPIDWAFQYLMGFDSLGMILSGMSSLEQMKDNVQIFEKHTPLNEQETKTLYEVADSMKNSLPCTGCRYCTEGCPMGLDIPLLIATFNDLNFQQAFTGVMAMEALPEDKKPHNCIGCGACAAICPQSINIPQAMIDLNGLLQKFPSWTQICKEREEAAKALEGK